MVIFSLHYISLILKALLCGSQITWSPSTPAYYQISLYMIISQANLLLCGLLVFRAMEIILHTIAS